MNKIFWLVICIIFLTSCNKNNIDENKEKEKLTYNEMMKLLNDYGEILHDKLIDKDGNLIDDFITLKELQKMGYDISMFINIETMEHCDLDKSYGIFKILGTTADGKTDYEYGFVYDCGEY